MAIYRGAGGSIDGLVTPTTIPVTTSQGGTGATTANAGLNNLLPAQGAQSGKYLKTDGNNTTWDALDINTADISGVLPLTKGGTDSTTASGARTSLGLAIGVDIPSNSGTGATGTWAISVTGNAATATNGLVSTGSYADPAFITSLAGSKVTGNISGNATNVTGTVALANGGTGATTAANARTNLLPSYSGNALKVLSLNAGGTDVEWSTSAGTGTVTSVAASAGTGISVSGSPITTNGTITITNTSPDQTVVLTSGTGISTSGTYPNFTITNTSPSLGGDVVGPSSATDNAVARFDSTTGKLLQNSVVTVGDTGAVSGVTTLAASTSVTTPIVQATNSGGLAFKNSVGTTQISMGGGGGDNASINVSTNINGANAQIDISPTGTGHVHIKPTGTGSLEIAPTNAGTMNNMVIGGTTPLAITGTTITANTGFTGNVTGNVSGNAGTVTNGVYTAGDQTIGGTKTFSSTITGSISGNAGTVTNGVVTTGSYANPSFITSLAETKVLPSQTGNSGKYLTTNGTSSSWVTITANPALDDLSDVTITTPATDQVLKYNGTAWVNGAAPAGGQYFGSATVKAIAYNANTIGENVTVTTGNNGLSAGPVTISSGFTVTVQSGAAWVIV